MQKTGKIWVDGKLVERDDANVHILTHSLHYGSAVFEGIRIYKGALGSAVFRLDDHISRFFYSAKIMGMQLVYSEEEIKAAILELLKINNLEEGYIRPIAFYGEKMGLAVIDPSNKLGASAPVHVAIAAWPWGKYLEKDLVSAMISKIMRIHPKSSVMGAKISGHYSNSILATTEAKKAGYDEAILLDYKGNIAEGPGENIFFVKGKTIYTPKKEAILPGITRDSVMQIAKDLKYKVIEKDIKPLEIKKFDEAFFTGTAAEISPIGKIEKMKFKKAPVIGKQIQEIYYKAVRGEIKKYEKWLSVVY